MVVKFYFSCVLDYFIRVLVPGKKTLNMYLYVQLEN